MAFFFFPFPKLPDLQRCCYNLAFFRASSLLLIVPSYTSAKI